MKRMFQNTMLKILAGIMGTLMAALEPTINYVVICTLAVLYDCYSAWELSRRVKKKYPGANDGKFKSHYAKRIVKTIMEIYVAILLAHLVDTEVFHMTKLYLPNIVAGAFLFIQAWSILENKSSCNGSRWAKVVQRIAVNKAERHFDIDLSELKKMENKEDDSTDR